MPSDFGDDVAHAERFEHGAHRAAGDDAGTGRSRTHDNLARSVMAARLVMQRTAVLQRHADQRALGGVGRLADRFRHFAGLAMAEADATALIADDDERRKTETTAALHHFRHTVDVDQLVDEFVVALFALAMPGFTRHIADPLLRTRGRLRERPPPAP